MNNVRTLAIADYVQEKRYCSSTDLISTFGVSHATIQRDIAALVRHKMVRRVHGGVATIDSKPMQSDSSTICTHFAQRVLQNTQEKHLIARLAASEIHDRDIVFLDSSTTSLFLARQLQVLSLTQLTLVTNSVPIIQEFRLFPRYFTLLALGGNYDYRLDAFLGQRTLGDLQKLKIHRAFISAAGMTRDGFFTYHENHADFLRHVLHMSETTIAMLDGSKFGRTGIFNICPLSQIDRLMTDQAPPDFVDGLVPVVFRPNPTVEVTDMSYGVCSACP